MDPFQMMQSLLKQLHEQSMEVLLILPEGDRAPLLSQHLGLSALIVERGTSLEVLSTVGYVVDRLTDNTKEG